MDTPQDGWRSRSGFLLAALGSAIGLGNIWRFPYLAYRNGGGAFLIPYAISIATIGMTLMLVELTIGHRFRASQPSAFGRSGQRWEAAGWWAIAVGLLGVTLYYCVVIGWTLNFFAYSLNLAWEPDPKNFFFKEFLGLTAGPSQLGGMRWPILLSAALVWAVCWRVVSHGIAHGIERALKILMPLMIGLLFILMIWSLFLPGAGAGIAAYLKPDFSKLLSLRVWGEAVGQTFFSLSLGFGIMVAYARYLPREADLRSNAAWIVLGDTLFAVAAGVVVFGTMGFMAHEQGVALGEVIKAGPGLTFVAFPQAISSLPALRSGFGALFFLSLFIAGLSSAISLIEALASALTDKFRVPRTRVVNAICAAGFLGSLIYTTGAGLYLLDIVDHHVTQYGLFLSGLLVSLFGGWRMDWGARAGRGWLWLLRWAIPAALGALLVSTLIEDIGKPYEGYPVSMILLLGWGWLAALGGITVWTARRPGAA